MKIVGRDPAAWLAFVAAIVQLAAASGLDINDTQQGLINAAATAVMGLAISALVSRERIIPTAAGAVAAVGQLAIALGVPVSQQFIGTLAVAVTAGLALWLYGKVTAPIDAEGNKVPPVSLVSSRRV